MDDRDDDFARYVAQRWPALLRIAIGLGCSADEAQDVVQSALVKCYVSWARVTRAENRDAYVARVLINAHRDAWRRRGARPTDVVADGAVPDRQRAYEAADLVHRALAGLTDGQRQALVLRYWLDLTEADIATALGVARGTVKSRLSRALAVLAENPDLHDHHEGSGR